MRICRYQLAGEEAVRIGIVADGAVRDVSEIAGRLPPQRWPLPPGDLFIVPLDRVMLRCPIANPGKFLCGAGNYEEVVAMGGHPRRLGLLFKMTSAAAGPADGVTLRWPERTTFYETELAIVIGRGGTEIAAADAIDHVAGYAIGLDMTMQGPEFPSFGKSFDSYGVIGPWLVTADEIPDPAALGFTLEVNGEVRQQDRLSRLVLDVPLLIEHAASIMTLHPGDVIFSGTPPGSVGPVVPGDVMVARMDGIGEMTVAVRGGPGRRTPEE